MATRNSLPHYEPLLSEPDQVEEKVQTPTSRNGTYFTTPMALLLVFCTVVNIIFASLQFTNVFVPSSTQSIRKYNDISKLRRPSQFIGLDKIQRPSPPVPRQIINFPVFLSQVDRDRPSMVFKEAPAEYLSHAGTISPTIKKGQITSTISTIAQFRVLDYKMESCELRFQLNDTLPSTPFVVFRAEADRELDGSRLNYKNRPKRADLIGDLKSSSNDGNLEWSQTFPCTMDELLTFEISCSAKSSSDECDLTWLQHYNDKKGFYIIQHSTI